MPRTGSGLTQVTRVTASGGGDDVVDLAACNLEEAGVGLDVGGGDGGNGNREGVGEMTKGVGGVAERVCEEEEEVVVVAAAAVEVEEEEEEASRRGKWGENQCVHLKTESAASRDRTWL
jgi:hypothetical protein